MKLFSIKVTVDGKKAELVGINEKVNDSTYKYEEYYIFKWNHNEYTVFDEYGKYSFGHKFKVIGTLSDVTEDMAKEWGYKESNDVSAVTDLYFKLVEITNLHTADELNSILLILIKDE